jgi:hypothetical protein
MANTYLKYIDIQRETGWFDNYKDIDNQLTKQNGEVNLEDANGRRCGTVIAHKETLPIETVLRAKNCWDKAIIRLSDINSPRAMAYAIKGLYNYYSIYKDELIESILKN